jgi:FtsP/CotA-like multicopper oxidase with cupredoxin domain
MLAFALVGGTIAASGRAPGPILRAREGQTVTIHITNERPEPHRFEITEVPGSTVEVAPGCTGSVTFTAPRAGTYIYHDTTGGAFYRVLGLHGVLAVAPPLGDVTPGGRVTPYNLAHLQSLNDGSYEAICALFDAFGTTSRFPGGPWVPAQITEEASIQEKFWIANSVDPTLNALLQPGVAIPASSIPASLEANFVPRYFTMNNRSGYDLHRDNDGDLPVIVANYIGEPTLIRTVNVGLCHHSPHIHGNHVFDLARVDLVQGSSTYGRRSVPSNIFEVDTWELWPMQRRDVLLPLEVPPDIPYKVPLSAPSPQQSQFQRMVDKKAQEPFPLRYVMHCHTEMSQTAGGGNYPQGLVTHWELWGGVGGRAKAQLASR